jgi:hypothetical protein
VTKLRVEKLLAVFIAASTVVLLTACGGSEEAQTSSPLQSALRDVVPDQVGDYTLQEAVNTDPEPTGAEEFVESMYQAPDGEQFYFALWAYPSEDEADQMKQEAIIDGVLENQDYSPAEMFTVDDFEGNRLGTGQVLQSSEFETITWTDNSVLAVVDAPRGGYGMDFYQDLYSDREGTSLTSGAA